MTQPVLQCKPVADGGRAAAKGGIVERQAVGKGKIDDCYFDARHWADLKGESSGVKESTMLGLAPAVHLPPSFFV
jgi:hypothetical protein